MYFRLTATAGPPAFLRRTTEVAFIDVRDMASPNPTSTFAPRAIPFARGAGVLLVTVGAARSRVTDSSALALCVGWWTPNASARTRFRPSARVTSALHRPPAVTVVVASVVVPFISWTVAPAVPVPVIVTVVRFVRLSVPDCPVSLSAVRSGVDGATIVGSMKNSRPATGLTFPARSMTTDFRVVELLIATGCTDDEPASGSAPLVVYRMTEDASSPAGRLSVTNCVAGYWPPATSLVGAAGATVSLRTDLLVPEMVPAGIVKLLVAVSVPSESPATSAPLKLTA